MAKPEYNSPMDLIAVYMTANVGIGQKLNISTIRKRLAALPLFAVLDVLAQVNYRADKAIDKTDAEAIANSLLRPVYAAKAVKLINAGTRERYFVVASQVVTGLAINALAYCEFDEYEGDFDVQELAYELGDLLMALGATLDSQLNRDAVLMEMVRLDLWARVHDYDRWYELAHRLIFEILPSLQASDNWIDFGQLIKEASGIDLDTFWALTNSMAIHVDNTPNDGHKFPHYTDTPHLDNAVMDKWVEFWTVPVDEAREAAKQDVLDPRLWSFNAFYERPIVDLDGKMNIVIRPWFLAQKATPVGFFSTVERIIRELSKDEAERKHNFLKWARLFGEATELLGRKLIDEYMHKLPRIDEADIKTQWPGKGKVCDSVFLDDDWLPLDFVYRRISKVSATTGDINDLAIDLERGVIEKLHQIDETLVRGIAAKGEPKGAIYPLVVVGAPFSVNGLVLDEIDKRADAENLKVVGQHKKCKPPLVIDLAEFWLLLETAQYNNLTPTQLIEQWLQSPLRVSGFRNWLVTHGPKQAPPKGKRLYAQHALKHLFGRTK